MNIPYITIFTPTYNRKQLLIRLKDSLLKQNAMNFEWLIVDDASTDGTEEIVTKWLNTAFPYEIRYVKQPHGGKHRALNKGVQMARGTYFFIVDSDDYLTADATEKIELWGRMAENKENIAGVSGLRISRQGVLGGFPMQQGEREYIEAGNFERVRFQLTGDKAEAYKTSVMQQYPFPEFEGEYFVTEGVCWDAIAADGYKLWWFAKPIYHCEYLEGGLTKSGANELEGHKKNVKGYCYYVEQSLRVKPALLGITEFRQYHKFGRTCGRSLREQADGIHMSIAEYLMYLLVRMPVLYFVRIMLKILRKINFV